VAANSVAVRDGLGCGGNLTGARCAVARPPRALAFDAADSPVPLPGPMHLCRGEHPRSRRSPRQTASSRSASNSACSSLS